MAKKRNWIKVEKEPPFDRAVHAYLKNGDTFMVLTAHKKKGKWYMFDLFTESWREVRHSQLITHWCYMMECPK
jgi:hypothetical protein